MKFIASAIIAFAAFAHASALPTAGETVEVIMQFYFIVADFVSPCF